MEHQWFYYLNFGALVKGDWQGIHPGGSCPLRPNECDSLYNLSNKAMNWLAPYNTMELVKMPEGATV